MDVLYPICCGLDVHKKEVVACLRSPGPHGRVQTEVRRFGTMTNALLEMLDWLVKAECTHVAMESTGVYWKPVYNLLEDVLTVWVVNAQHVKAVSGRKTDVKDAEWLAQLLQHGLLKPSFVPDRAQRELRELVRYRTSLLQERSAEVNRLQKVLEGANIKLGSALTDVMGVSGRAIVAALADGQSDAAALAALAVGQLRKKRAELERALTGRMQAHQCFMLTEQLCHIDFMDERIAALDAEVAARMATPAQDGTRPFEAAVERLDTIPGVGRRTAEAIVTEIGVDMSRFPTHRHLAAWAGMCPGNNESAGKHRSGRTRKGSPALRAALTQAGWAAGRTQSYLGAQYRRLVKPKGRKRAVVAVGHSILVIAYHMIEDGTDYADLGPNYFDHRNRTALQTRLVRRLERLGCKVTIEPLIPHSEAA